MESSPEASVPVGGVLGDSSGSDGLSEILLDQYSEVDVSSEWLSSFVEECLSGGGTCFLPPKDHQTPTTTATNTGTTINSSKTLKQVKPLNKNRSPTNPKLAVPSKPRGQRKKRKMGSSSKTHKNPLTIWSDQLKQRGTSLHSSFSDPPLLEQTHWLADSELLTMPRREEEEEEEVVVVEEVEKMEEEMSQGQGQVPRRCTHCQSQKTPQWRAGPLGPGTLCNACGVRYSKSGRLLPEYRPANSPTFLSFKHSNIHKKVLEMRMELLSSSTSSDQ